jgi:hypothetical protein
LLNGSALIQISFELNRSHLKHSRSQLKARRTPMKKRSPPAADEHYSEAFNAAIDSQMHF